MSFNMPLYPEEENLAKVVKFEEGSISAIGLKLDKVTPPSGERPGDIVLFTRKSTISDYTMAKLRGYGIYAHHGIPGKDRSHYIALYNDIPPDLQLRNIVDRLYQDRLLSSKQKEKAYNELGLGEDLYNRPTKEGRVL
jgi:hypothetical protein